MKKLIITMVILTLAGSSCTKTNSETSIINKKEDLGDVIDYDKTLFLHHYKLAC